MSRRRLRDKRILLTGASSGLGRSLAQQLAASGARLVITARREDRLDSLKREMDRTGSECHVVAGDLTVADVRQTLLDICLQSLGGVDCLINNAGIGAMGRFDTASDQRMRQIFEVNFFAMANLIRLFLPALKNGNDSLIVNIGSVLGHRAVPLKSEYTASKFAIHGFSDALRAELAAIPLGVLLVSPGTINSQFFDSAIEDTTGKKWIGSSAMQPEYVARKIIAAMVRRKHELILPASGKALVWLDRLCPSLANRVVARFGQ